MNRYKLAAIWAIAMVVIDQITKIICVQSMQKWTAHEIIPGFFNLVHVRNRGAAWGFLDRGDIDWQVPLFIGVTILALGFITYMLKTTTDEDRWMVTGLGLIAGGAIGNFIDRVRLGEVVDFLDFYINTYHWPAFNVADIALTIGAGCIIISMYINRNAEESA